MSPKATERGAEVANPKGLTEGLLFSEDYNPPVSFAASPLYTRGPFYVVPQRKLGHFYKCSTLTQNAAARKPARSAHSAAGTAWRVLRTPAAPK